MMLLMFAFLLVLLFIIPFAPGFRELVIEEDVSPLFINMDYRREPRYFGISFRKLLTDAVRNDGNRSGLRQIKLSRQEDVEVSCDASFGSGYIVPYICFVKGDLKSGYKVLFQKEIYVQGSAVIGEGSQIRALACDGNVHVQSRTKFVRWLDAAGSIRIEEQCDLGISASSEGELSVASHCSFQRLYGCPVLTGESTAATQAFSELTADHAIVFPGRPERNCSNITAHAQEDRSIITYKSLTIGEYAWIRGDIKTHGDLIAEQGVTITGNVFAEGNVHIGPNCRVLGTVFSQSHITLDDGVVIGCRGKIKSVISKKGITFCSGVKVYGFVLTEGEGRVI